MSRSNMYAEVVDLTPVLAMMNEHANQGLPFISLEYGDDYLEWTKEGKSTMPSQDEIESWNLDGINALEPEAWRHLLSIATKIVGLTFGTGGPGVSIRTSDGRNVSVVPVTREKAYKPLNEIKRKIFEADMGKANKMEPIGEVLEAFGAKPEPGRAVIFELTWHGPVCDVAYSVEADTEEDAMQEVCRALNENDEKWLRSHEAEENE